MRESDALESGQVALLGVPWDAHSSFLHGPALAPRQIRAALHSGAMNLCAESGHDLGTDERWRDLGDVAVPAGDDAALAAITGAAQAVLERGARLLALGGNHAVSFPLLRAYGAAYPGLTVLHLDAHLQQQHHFNDAAVVLGKQLLRSGTAVAANHRESKHSRSAADRIAKFQIVLQELEESALWLELLAEHQMANQEGLQQLLDETNQLIGIFISTIKTLHSSDRDG